MSKMKEYDLFIPISYNSGLPIELRKLLSIKGELIDKFRGLSMFNSCDRYWRDFDGRLNHDINYVYRVVADDTAEVRSFMLDLKSRLQELLEQESIFITVRDVEIL